jgi:hypothetical protein
MARCRFTFSCLLLLSACGGKELSQQEPVWLQGVGRPFAGGPTGGTVPATTAFPFYCSKSLGPLPIEQTAIPDDSSMCPPPGVFRAVCKSETTLDGGLEWSCITADDGGSGD